MTSVEPTFIASFWTLAGSSHPLACQGISVVPFADRVEAAAAAGYSGFAFLHTDLAALLDDPLWSYRTIRRHLEQNGLDFVELEVLTDWFAADAERNQSDVVRRLLLEAAAELGAHHIKVVGDFSDRYPVREMVDSFAVLCQEAAAAGTKIAIELTPLTNLVTPQQGLELIQVSSAGNGGLLLDTWQMGRAGVPFASLADIPAEMIIGVELGDADEQVRGSLMEDTMLHRRLPGAGALEPAKFIAAVRDAGYRGPYGIEIISDAHRSLHVRDQARVAIDSARAQFRIAERDFGDQGRRPNARLR